MSIDHGTRLQRVAIFGYYVVYIWIDLNNYDGKREQVIVTLGYFAVNVEYIYIYSFEICTVVNCFMIETNTVSVHEDARSM